MFENGERYEGQLLKGKKEVVFKLRVLVHFFILMEIYMKENGNKT